MQLNREFYETIPENLKEMIEKAYLAVDQGEITINDFLNICEHLLDPLMFKKLFIFENQTEVAKPQNKEENIKTENIDDIIQYTGVDLKEEAENITKDIEYVDYMQNPNFNEVDDDFSTIFDLKMFTKYINNCCAARNVKITEDGVNLIFRAMKRKILDLAEKLVRVSDIRTEANLLGFDFNIKNEHSKQLWYLNELEKIYYEKLNLKKEDDKAKRKIVQEREDLLIKKRQSNTVAMAAMGLKQKSWLRNEEVKEDEINKFESIYSPFDEKGFENKCRDRMIIMKDFLYVLENDKRYNKSAFLINLYYKL